MTRRITLGNYELSGVLGRGGAGEVYLAEDKALGREVAFKTLHAANGPNGADWRKRFKLEARTLAQLNCANIAGIYALESFERFDAIIMEYVKGPTLAALTGRLAAPAVIHAGVELAKGLEVAHAAGVLHRDLKPANAIVTADGTVKLIDFGIAQQEGGERLTRQGCLVGTLHYMAPEAFGGAATSPSTDVYGLAATLYELLTGAAPFADCSETELLRAKMNGEAPKPLPTSIGSPLRRVIEAGLQSNPDNRPSTAADFRRQLETLASADGREILVSALASAPKAKPAPLTRSLIEAMRAASAQGSMLSGASSAVAAARSRLSSVLPSVSDDTAVVAAASAFTLALSAVTGLFVIQSGALGTPPAAHDQPAPAITAFATDTGGTLETATEQENTAERLSRLLNTPVSQPTFHEPQIAYDIPREIERPRSIDPMDQAPAESGAQPVAETLPVPAPTTLAPAPTPVLASPPSAAETTDTNPEPDAETGSSAWTWKDT
ncbi:MAG: protein kinase [Pseudomonadota bacterium]